MTDTPIVLNGVSRAYDGRDVLRDLSLAVERGSIFGFLGRNGSGKTTTLRMLAGLIRPGCGTVRVQGGDPFTFGARERLGLGYQSENVAISPMCRVRALLRLGRDLYPAWDESLVRRMMARHGLDERRKFGTLSLGQQRMLGFLLAVAPRPEVLLLDEPAANLDVVARREMLDDILALVREQGTTVLFSTHQLGDVERVADRVGILAEGRLRVSEPLDALKESVRQVRFYGFTRGLPVESVPGSFRTVRGADELVATLWVNAPGADPEQLAIRWGCAWELRLLSLEDIFVELSRKGDLE